MPRPYPLLAACLALASALTASAASAGPPVHLPPSGWSQEKQAVHVLNRLAYGPSPASLAEVQAMGVQAWIWAQLHPDTLEDAAVLAKLSNFRSLQMTTAERLAAYQPEAKLAKERGVDLTDPEARAKLLEEMPLGAMPRQMGLELVAAKLIRATESRRQLQEVLLDFWFNHFNVAAQKGAVRWMLASYEQEALRPHLFGSFRTLLGAVAHHPAMLFYLDNWLSTRDGLDLAALRRSGVPVPKKLAEVGKLGLNENYARELLELHTLGVDGGYTQADVREVARCFTGWGIDRPSQVGTFAFHPLAHDGGEKHVLGTTVSAGGGMDDGERVLDLLAAQPGHRPLPGTEAGAEVRRRRPPPAAGRARGPRLPRHAGATCPASTWPSSQVRNSGATQAFDGKTKTPLEFAVSAVRALGGTTAGERPAGEGGGPPWASRCTERSRPPVGRRWPRRG